MNPNDTNVTHPLEPVAGESSVGKAASFRALFNDHAGYVAHSLRRLGVLHCDLADMTQEVFFVVHRKISDFDRSRPLRPWLFGIAFRIASDYRNLARHKRELVTDDLSAQGRVQHDDGAIRDLVIRSLQSLDLNHRAVLTMHDIDGYEMEELTSVLGISLGTGYTRLRTARRQFATAVERLRCKERSS